VACLVSHDNGQTWHDFAKDAETFHVYALGGCRLISLLPSGKKSEIHARRVYFSTQLVPSTQMKLMTAESPSPGFSSSSSSSNE